MAGPRNAETTSKGRVYRWRDETFDSVTTIIGGGVPKPALTSWAARSVAEYVADNLASVTAVAKDDRAAAIDLMRGSPWRERDAAAAKGSDVHAAAEAHVLGEPQPEWPKLVAPSMRQFELFLDAYQPTFEMTEASVYSRRYEMAGTLDAICVIDGQRLLLDYKTGKGVYGEVAMQLAGYRYMDFVGMPNGDEIPMPEVDGCAVLHLRPQSYKLIPVRAGELELRYLLYAQQIRHFCNHISREVIGAPVAPGELAVRDEVEVA